MYATPPLHLLVCCATLFPMPDGRACHIPFTPRQLLCDKPDNAPLIMQLGGVSPRDEVNPDYDFPEPVTVWQCAIQTVRGLQSVSALRRHPYDRHG